MRVLQLIDSLDAGGAERAAVNLANTLCEHIDKSFLCTTRHEGILKESLSRNVGYLNLNKSKSVDYKAIKTLKAFIKTHNIHIIHAHSSSIFTAVLVKILGSNVKIVWHDHYGKSEFLQQRPVLALKICTLFIEYSFAVNNKLLQWGKTKLGIKHSEYLPNFVSYIKQKPQTKLNGTPGFRLVCLANLRFQKDHINLINAFSLFVKVHPKYTLHLIGKDFEDAYSKQIKELVVNLNLEKVVFFYGSRLDTFHILKQCNIAVLASNSEGLPLSLLEYGLVKLPVVVTNVGDCSKVVLHSNNGMLVEPNNPKTLANSLKYLANNTLKAKQLGYNLYTKVSEEFSETAVINKILFVYKNLNNGY